MLFNSLQFLIFYPLVTVLFFMLPQRFRWSMLLAASCVFYMAFIPAYIAILAITILIDYLAGIWIEESSGRSRRIFLVGSVVSTCMVLFVFKYYNFFWGSAEAISRLLHLDFQPSYADIILPIGLSFHTFQSLSYVIEVYRGNQKAERHLGIYSLYVMFYPQLVAGPIERPQNLLHQFREEHRFDFSRMVGGLRLMLWGLFKKVVIADRLAMIVAPVYANPHGQDGAALLLATVAFAFQIFCDFSGYSDIAIGAARTMGFDLMTNFRSPYLSSSVAEFWKRWHISLSTWFKDYLYISLGGNRVGRWLWYSNLLVTFTISGLWHGANWTYVAWGALNGTYLVCGIVTLPLRRSIAEALGWNRWPRLGGLVRIATTFALICFSWIFFRAESIQDAVYIAGHLLSGLDRLAESGYAASLVANSGLSKTDLLVVVVAIATMESVHVIQLRRGISELVQAQPTWIRWSLYYAGVLAVVFFGVFSHSNFIYFQF